jgi:hypothetical protein
MGPVLVALWLAGTAQAAGKARPPGILFSTLDEARACDRLDEGLADQRAQVESETRFNQQALTELQADSDQILELQHTLDEHDDVAIEVFNARVKAHNERMEEVNRRAQAGNALMRKLNEAAYARNQQCMRLVISERDYQTLRKERAQRARAKAAAASASAASAP